MKYDQVIDVPVVEQRQIHMDRTAQKTSETPKLQFVDKVVDVPVVLVVQFPQVQVVEEAVEVPQSQLVGKIADIPEEKEFDRKTNHRTLVKHKIEKITVLTKTIEEKTVRVETLAVEVEKMRSELFDAERALLATPFAKVKGLITCLFNRLQAEAPSEVSYMSCRDEGTSKATEKKEDLDVDDAKHSSKLEAAVDGENSTLQLLGIFLDQQLQMDTTRADERDQDCEALCRINKQSPNIAGGVHVDENDLDDDAGLRVVTQMVNVPVVMQRAAAAQDRSIQQHNNKPQQPTKQTTQERERGQTEKGRKGEREKKEKERETVEEGDKEVKKDVMGWTVVTTSRKQRKRTVQIFVKVDGIKTVLREVSPEDIVQKILNTVSGSDQDVHAMYEGKC